jgi:hypothetical protein
MKLYRFVIAAAALMTASVMAHADDGAVRASCTTKDGQVIYREDLPVGTSADRRLQIASAHRNALCVFLKVDAVATEQEGHEPALAALSGGGNEDLASALAYLSPGSSVGTPYGGAFDKSMKSFMKTENAFTDEVKSVNLTIGVYANATSEDVLGHWAYIMKNTKALSRMTPSIERVGDVVVLSVEGVADEDASLVCQEAEKYASGCIAVY